MRALLLTLFVAACSPEITAGAYLCGDEQACPEGLACDGPTGVCELPSVVAPFNCGPDVDEAEPNDTFPTAQLVDGLQCVSRVAEVHGCAKYDNSAEDWFGFSVPSTCGSVRAKARISFPIAFEPLVLELVDASGAVRGTAELCDSDDEDGDAVLCLDAPVTPSGQFAIRVAGAGTADCDGACAFNRYTMTMQLVSP